MYAKTLVPEPPLTIPTLTATTSAADILLPQLLACGWGRFGGPTPLRQRDSSPSPTTGQLVIDDQVVLNDINPASPPGWWEAVDQLSGRVSGHRGGQRQPRPDPTGRRQPTPGPAGH